MNIMENILVSILTGEAGVSSKDFGFNSNILEANVINILILVSSVTYLGRNFFISALNLRQRKITETIQEAEEKLQQAIAQLTESEKQMSQSKLVIEQIKKEAEATAKKVKESILAQGKLDIKRLANSGRRAVEKVELQIKQEIQQHITALTLKTVSSQLKEMLTPSIQSKLIDSNISQLGGHI